MSIDSESDVLPKPKQHSGISLKYAFCLCFWITCWSLDTQIFSFFDKLDWDFHPLVVLWLLVVELVVVIWNQISLLGGIPKYLHFFSRLFCRLKTRKGIFACVPALPPDVLLMLLLMLVILSDNWIRKSIRTVVSQRALNDLSGTFNWFNLDFHSCDQCSFDHKGKEDQEALGKRLIKF